MTDRTHDKQNVEILSGPELFLLFSFLRASFIISEVMFAKIKFSSVPHVIKVRKSFFSAFNSSCYRSGPILAKKILKPSDTSTASERAFPLLTNVSGMLTVLRPLPSTLWIVCHVCLLYFWNLLSKYFFRAALTRRVYTALYSLNLDLVSWQGFLNFLLKIYIGLQRIVSSLYQSLVNS